MPEARYDVVGIGNALADVIAHATDAFLVEHDLVKGSMQLIDTDRAVQLYRALGTALEMSGGSAANAMCGVASLGGRAAYIGKVADDDLGDVFGHDLNALGVAFHRGVPEGDTPTGRCIIVVTPEGERTMSTYLGVAELLSSDDLDQAVIADGAVLYMEGYLYDRDDAKKAFRRAAGIAHDAGRKVSLTLSDSFCVDRHRQDFAALVRDEVDILFGNSAELCSLYELDSLDDAIARVRTECELAAITAGKDGSYVVTADDVDAGAGRARGPGARHDRRRRPLRRRVPLRLHPVAAARRVRAHRLDRRRRGDQPRRAEAAGRAAYAAAVTPAGARSSAERWLAAEPDADVRAELQALLDGPDDELAARFDGGLTFGTAGLRAAIGAGPLRMNRLVVRQAARGLAEYVLELDADAADRGVVIGFDARRKSDVFALDSARVIAAAGLRVHLLPTPLPTPVVAWGVTELGCAAGVMVTASHNPPADNGYKVYLGDGAQIVPPHDAVIAERIAAVDPTTVAMAAEDDDRDRPAATVVRGRLRRRDARDPDAPGRPRRRRRLHPDARRRRRDRPARLRGRRPARAVGREGAGRSRPGVPDGVVPQPGGAGGDGPRRRPRRRASERSSPSPTIPTPIASARRSRSPTGRGDASVATRSGGCSPTTS